MLGARAIRLVSKIFLLSNALSFDAAGFVASLSVFCPLNIKWINYI